MELVSNDESRPAVGTQIQSVARASRLLLWLAAQPDGATASEAARAVELALPTTYHLLNTLVANGLVAKDSRRRYGMGPKVALLAESYLASDRVPEYMLAPLRRLAEETGETAYLAAWRGGEIRALASIQGTSPIRVAEVQRGPYRHAHARATGKLLLALAGEEARHAYLAANPLQRMTDKTILDPAAFDAELARIREAGYASDHEEFIPGVSCIAAPVLAEDAVVAAYTVSAPAERFALCSEELLAAVSRAAAAAAAPAGRVPETHHSPEAA